MKEVQKQEVILTKEDIRKIYEYMQKQEVKVLDKLVIKTDKNLYRKSLLFAPGVGLQDTKAYFVILEDVGYIVTDSENGVTIEDFDNLFNDDIDTFIKRFHASEKEADEDEDAFCKRIRKHFSDEEIERGWIPYDFFKSIDLTEIHTECTSMVRTFAWCKNLEEVLSIPKCIKNMKQTFLGCSGLKNVPVIPDGVENMEGTFDGCTSLTATPAIPKS